MKIESITITNFGPFLGNHTLALQPDVTVLTGANDTGKSTIIDLLALVCLGRSAGQNQINVVRAGMPDGGLDDRGMCIEMRVAVLPEDNLTHLPGLRPEVKISPGDKLILVRALGPGHNLMASKLLHAGGETPISIGPLPSWKLIRLPTPPFRATVPLSQANESEAALFRWAFGPDFQRIARRVPNNWTALVRAKEAEITKHLNALLPAPMGFDVNLTPDANGQINVSLVDRIGTGVSLDSRGSGAQKILAVLGPLLEAQSAKAPTVVLLDEPENSLHADAQHRLRTFLEQIGRQPLVQVVYATHSPAMINNMREGSVRVLRRKQVAGGATSFIESLDGNNQNLALVRRSLGIAPSDSLLYADLTIVVEGKTEVRCLPILLQRLEKDGLKEFEGASSVLENAHFFDGEGDSLEFRARLAKSNGCRVIVFLDGDRRQRSGEKRLRQEHPEVPVIRLPGETDFESLVARNDYFKAIADEADEHEPPAAGGDGKMLTQDSFNQWLSEHQCRSLKEAMFGKQVQRWLEANGFHLSKYAIMQRAVETCALRAVNTAELAKLVAEANRLLATR